ncbi:DUF3889 domain-containing protein [Bacillus horti]|uniref:DUF3889 domain-containing protein n=1 Tax=Caldalkalibacillus horti TaxID=77523 RepID=A0ABT9VVP0_9BACI|nr:DUF3889 domain-containing protein [Bacillus horti]MDQ0165055.1 hypothetical protein [Bacillus horti]
MKSLLKYTLLSCCLFVLFSGFTLPANAVASHQAKNFEMAQIPYAKWGDLAVKIAKDTFPDFEVSDYKYIGREEKSANTTQDQFELILTKNSQKRDVIVSILFNKQSGEVISVNFEEK